jgi:hypothetical protein
MRTIDFGLIKSLLSAKYIAVGSNFREQLSKIHGCSDNDADFNAVGRGYVRPYCPKNPPLSSAMPGVCGTSPEVDACGGCINPVICPSKEEGPCEQQSTLNCT